MATVTFYTKPNCPLCDKALEQIERARGQCAFDLVEINILSDLEIYERYKHAIPVVAVEGVEVFRYRLSSDDFVARLKAATKPSSF
ncbi:MAG: glutaredoxin family protein [Verrucomicrobia bacterium]|nr:glutaredoxin family protein [Verrucomicrobiota bacterium]